MERSNSFENLRNLHGRCGLADLRVLYNNAPATVVSIAPEDNVATKADYYARKMPFRSPPNYSFTDDDILSPYCHVRVWKFPEPGERTFTFSKKNTNSVTECTSIPPSKLPSLCQSNVIERSPIKSVMRQIYSQQTITPPGKFDDINHQGMKADDYVCMRSSKVAQLQRQQNLASKFSAERKKNAQICPSTTQTLKQASLEGTDPKSLENKISSIGRKFPTSLLSRQSVMKSDIKSISKAKLLHKKLWPSYKIRCVFANATDDESLNLSETMSSLKEETHFPIKDYVADSSKSSSTGLSNKKASKEFIPLTTTSFDEKSSGLRGKPSCCNGRSKGSIQPEHETHFCSSSQDQTFDRSANQCKQGVDIPKDLTYTFKTVSSWTTETTTNLSDEEFLHSHVEAGFSFHCSPEVHTQHEFRQGDLVEILLGDDFQVGVIDKQTFKGVYDVIISDDIPAWKEMRNKFCLYEKYFREHGTMPEVPARLLRQLNPTESGEVLL